MNTVAFIVDALESHLYSSIGLARLLQRRGFAVEYWGVARNNSDALVREQGFPFHTLDGLWSRYQEDTRLPTDLTLLNAIGRSGELRHKVAARRARSRAL